MEKLNLKEKKQKQNEYMRLWRSENKEKLRNINRRYYVRNKGYLNKIRSRPWSQDGVLGKIFKGDKNYIRMMLRILRPHKDKLIGLENNDD